MQLTERRHMTQDTATAPRGLARDPRHTRNIRHDAQVKAWDTRGRKISPLVIPLFEEGKSVQEIAKQTGIERKSVRHAVNNARRNGDLERPTQEEKRRALLEARKGRTYVKGKLAGAETLMKMSQKRRGRELTDTEREQIELLALAREVPGFLHEPKAQEAFAARGMKFPVGWRNVAFLETAYVVMLVETRMRNHKIESYRGILQKERLQRIYEAVDPGAFGRTKDGISLIDTLRRERINDLVAAFYKEHETRMYTTARWLTRDHQTAEDLVQQVLMKMTEGNIAKYPQDPEKQQRYLTTVMLNEAKMRWRQERPRSTRAVPLDLSIASHHGADFSAERVALGRADLAAAMEQADPVVVYRGMGYSIRETAAAFEMPTGTVKTRTFRGREALKESFQENL